MSDQCLFKADGLVKFFGNQKALDGINLEIAPSSVHALVGENGAGKSTLIKIVAGIFPHGTYSGDFYFDGKLCKFNNILQSEHAGIAVIHQELSLVSNMTIAENMFLGHEIKKGLCIDWTKTYQQAQKYLDVVGLKERPNTLISDMSVGKQQLVEIAKALSRKARLLILDEPTSSLNDEDSKALLDLILQLRDQGVSCLFVSHKLNEISYVADTITVIRDGQSIETLDNHEHQIDEKRIITDMVGREFTDRFPHRREKEIGDIVFEIDNWNVYHPDDATNKVIDSVSMNVRKGEIIGVSGLMGAGRSELFLSVFGNSYGSKSVGSLKLNGHDTKFSSIRDAIDKGIAYMTEDRKVKGLFLNNAISFNTTSANLSSVTHVHIVDKFKESNVSNIYVNMLSTRSKKVDDHIINLSGGNQQKVLLAKWLFSNPQVLIIDEPTRGIDVGAKYEIYSQIMLLAEMGRSVIVISSELPELLGITDRIYVMNEGRVISQYNTPDATQESIMTDIMHDYTKKRVK